MDRRENRQGGGGKRTNGSRRARKVRRENRTRWAASGIKLGSVNIRGLTNEKIFKVLEQHNFDVVCVQETWMKGPVQGEIVIPGFTVCEQRREKGE